MWRELQKVSLISFVFLVHECAWGCCFGHQPKQSKYLQQKLPVYLFNLSLNIQYDKYSLNLQYDI